MRLLNLILFIAIAFPLFAQQVRFDRFDISNGLSQNNINCLEFDDNGNLWIGTLDGVNLYNGYGFKSGDQVVSREGKLDGNHVRTLGKGLNGDMWLVTRGRGLSMFDASLASFVKVDDRVFGTFNVEQTDRILQVGDSLVWFNDFAVIGAWCPQLALFQTYQAKGPVVGWFISENDLVIYGGFGVVKLKSIEQDSVLRIEVSALSDLGCYGMQRKGDQFYAVTGDGVVMLNRDFDFDRQIVEFTKEEKKHFQVQNLNDFAVTENRFWLGGDGFMVSYTLQNGTHSFHKYRHDPLNDYSFKGNSITHFELDAIGNLWIGTEKNGLLHFNRVNNQFKHYSWDIDPFTNPSSNPVRAICKTQNEKLWVGFDRQGVGVLESGEELRYFNHYYDADGEKRIIVGVREIFEDSRGNVWIGTANQLCYYNPEKDRVETIEMKFGWKWPYQCYRIKEFEDGIVTITSAVNIGMVHLNDGTLVAIPFDRNVIVNQSSVRDLVQDRFRNLWVALDDNGLVKINYPDFKQETITEANYNLSDDKVYSLHTENDFLWIGTNRGLNKFDITKNKFVGTFYEEDGLSNNVVYSVVSDANGNLWMSTNKGVSYYDETKQGFKSFLGNDYFMDDAFFKDEDGIIYFGGYTGVVSFNPSEISIAMPDIEPFIEQFSILNQTVYPGDTVNGRVVVDRPLKQLDQLTLNYRQNTFSLVFNAFPFDFPNSNQFRYRLEGFQDGWVDGGTNRTATYTKIPPGDYTFKLIATRNNSEQGEVVELPVSIVPPFWMTNWFKILIGIIVAGVVVLTYRIRVKQIKQRNKILQQKVEEQTDELRTQNQKILEISDQLHQADQSKLRFFTNISHEFKTPLTLILGYLDRMGDASESAIRPIRNNAIRLLRLINQLIDLRKMDQDQLELNVEEFDLVPFVEEVVEGFQLMAEQKNITLLFKCDKPLIDVWLDKDKTEKILFNLLSNALKYSSDHSGVSVTINVTDKNFHIEIKDEGKGIPKEQLSSIFERFYRLGDETGNGHGIGLSMVKGLTEAQKGNVSVESWPGEGSAFTVTFLQGKDHFESNAFGNSHNNLPVLENIAADISPEFVSRLGGKKVLVVEDNVELADFIRELLSASFRVKVAENGKEALEVIRNFVPDLIISDIMMPVMDGIQFCKTIKSAVATSHIPLILLSAKTDIETQVNGLETGADDYIAKPFHQRLLLAKVEAMLSNREKLKLQFMAAGETIELPENTFSLQDQQFIEKVNLAIDQHFQDSSFSVQLLSEQMNMSRATFYRKFSDLTGVKPADYIRRMRLKKAYQMLKNEKEPVAVVCEKVGFQSVSHFRKSFKCEFGKTPSSI